MNESLFSQVARRRAKYLQPVLVSKAVLGRAVASRHHAFSDHVACQEQPGGFLDFLANAAPRYAPLLDRARDDHWRLGRWLAKLRMKILRSDPTQWQALAAELDAVDVAIVDHTHLECEMLRDAFEPT